MALVEQFSSNSPKEKPTVYAKLAAELKAQPGMWGQVKGYWWTNALNYKMIKEGKIPDITLKDFDVQLVDAKLYIRYKGQA